MLKALAWRQQATTLHMLSEHLAASRAQRAAPSAPPLAASCASAASRALIVSADGTPALPLAEPLAAVRRRDACAARLGGVNWDSTFSKSSRESGRRSWPLRERAR